MGTTMVLPRAYAAPAASSNKDGTDTQRQLTIRRGGLKWLLRRGSLTVGDSLDRKVERRRGNCPVVGRIKGCTGSAVRLALHAPQLVWRVVDGVRSGAVSGNKDARHLRRADVHGHAVDHCERRHLPPRRQRLNIFVMITLFLHFLFFNLAKLHRGAKAAPPLCC